MKRKNSFLTANRLKTVSLCFVVNIILLVLYQFSALEFYGTIETPNVIWSTYTKFHNKNIETQVVISRKGEEEISSLFYDYQLSKSKSSGYIVVGGSSPEPVRHNRVLYLDEQCGLVFNSFAEMMPGKVTLRCLY